LTNSQKRKEKGHFRPKKNKLGQSLKRNKLGLSCAKLKLSWKLWFKL